MVKTRLHCIEFIRTCVRSAGSWKESTIEVRRATFRFRIQFPRRCFAPGRPGVSRETVGTASHCVGGPRWCLRCSTIAYGCKVRRDSASRWRRDFRGRFWKPGKAAVVEDRKSTRLNSSHGSISYAVFCLKKKNGRDTERFLYRIGSRGDMSPPPVYSVKRFGVTLKQIIQTPRTQKHPQKQRPARPRSRES